MIPLTKSQWYNTGSNPDQVEKFHYIKFDIGGIWIVDYNGNVIRKSVTPFDRILYMIQEGHLKPRTKFPNAQQTP